MKVSGQKEEKKSVFKEIRENRQDFPVFYFKKDYYPHNPVEEKP
jgi:hypothetical protein